MMLINNLSEFTPGEAVQCSNHVRRLLAPNPSMMTGPGTNTYIVGHQDIAIIDPGPAIPKHIDALLSNTKGESIRWIFCTHTHRDHSPATQLLLETLRERQPNHQPIHIIGLPAPTFAKEKKKISSHDENFNPTLQPKHGELFDVNGLTIEVVATPGHASNHLCFLLRDEKLLFTGDHIMDGSTVVIAPPDGDMKHYIDSLTLLKNYDINHLAPAHGNIIGDPKATVEATIAHRLKRESKVIAAVTANPNSTIKTLVSTVYDDTPSFLHPLAEHSLEAHLLKLKKDGKVEVQNDHWHWIL